MFHVIHKVPPGDSPYVKAKHLQGNLGWDYMQQDNYSAAEVVYQKAQLIEPDANKACNLGRVDNARRRVLEDVVRGKFPDSDGGKTVSRAEELLNGIGRRGPVEVVEFSLEEEEIMERLDVIMNEWAPFQTRRLPIFEEISTYRYQIAC